MDDETKGAPGRGRRSNRPPAKEVAARQSTAATADAQGPTLADQVGDWYMVPREVVLKAGPVAGLIWAHLWLRTRNRPGWCQSVGALAGNLRLGAYQVRRALQAMTEAGFVDRQEQPGQATVYRLPERPVWMVAPAPDPRETRAAPPRLSRGSAGEPPRKSRTTKSLKSNKETSKEVVVGPDGPTTPDPMAPLLSMVGEIPGLILQDRLRRAIAHHPELARWNLQQALEHPGAWPAGLIADAIHKNRRLPPWRPPVADRTPAPHGTPSQRGEGSRHNGDLGTCPTTGDMVAACPCDTCRRAVRAAYAPPEAVDGN